MASLFGPVSIRKDNLCKRHADHWLTCTADPCLLRGSDVLVLGSRVSRESRPLPKPTCSRTAAHHQLAGLRRGSSSQTGPITAPPSKRMQRASPRSGHGSLPYAMRFALTQSPSLGHPLLLNHGQVGWARRGMRCETFRRTLGFVRLPTPPSSEPHLAAPVPGAKALDVSFGRGYDSSGSARRGQST